MVSGPMSPQAAASGSGSGSGPDLNVDDYSVPRPSKIKLKETPQERARRIYDQEVRRQKRKDHLISRANGYAISVSPSPPPHSHSHGDDSSSRPGRGRGRDESITPPRMPVRPENRNLDMDTDVDQERKERERDRLAYLEAETLDRLDSDPFRSYSMPDVHIPKRFRHASPPFVAGPSSSTASRNGHVPGGSGSGNGRIPSMNGMNEDEYTQFIRDGMERLRNITDQVQRDRIRIQKEKVAEEKLRQEEAEERRREKRERRRTESKRSQPQPHTQAQAQAQARSGSGIYVDDEETVIDLVRDSKALERARYINLWQTLAGPPEVQQVEMRYRDIPWPIYGGSPLEKQSIYVFLSDLALDPPSGSTSSSSSTGIGTGVRGRVTKDQEKKILRDAIRIFHPDRFFGRFLDRVRISDRDKVRQGVEICSRVINALAAENAAR